MMDAPLLALTRRREVGEEVAGDTMRQLSALRWIAVGGQLATVVAVRWGLGVALPVAPMLAVVALLALANLVGPSVLRRHRSTNAGILLALLLDVAALTAQLFLSGGAANPFASFYLLQVVLAAILLDRGSAWVVVAVTGLCFAALTRRAVPIDWPPALLPHVADLMMAGAWIGFALTAVLLALFITRITRNLRARDRFLADLRRRTVEEDGIVRMGLFASGAAHELGTPLASLSVILSDWRRMPRLTGDPELAGELAEMQAEVERCKAIVTDILHSAGEPRVEAMASTEACAFLDEVVGGWRPTYGQGAEPLDYQCDEALDGAAVVASASLRQAIWNLLDNAAEASPAAVAITATREGAELAIAVADRGAGFPPAQLATVGRLYQSSKGAGHGVGLFLTANVVRRLGGRMEARNRAGGGAEVKLVLPLAPGRARGGEG